jgi:hypothetical protein
MIHRMKIQPRGTQLEWACTCSFRTIDNEAAGKHVMDAEQQTAINAVNMALAQCETLTFQFGLEFSYFRCSQVGDFDLEVTASVTRRKTDAESIPSAASDIALRQRVEALELDLQQARLLNANLSKQLADATLLNHDLAVGVFQEIAAERKRQDLKWGGPEHDDTHAAHDWKMFILQQCEGHIPFNAAMVRVAALAVAAIESQNRLSQDKQPDAQAAPTEAA